MFQLLQPIWLYAIAGITIPLIIHLWDIRGGKKMLVGSISLIDESARQQGRSLRLTDILLLIIRCFLIVLLAMVLAQPTWEKQLSATSEKGWILIEKASVSEAYKNFKPSIDSLLKSGYTFHYFNKGFAKERFEDALTNPDSLHREEISYWSLLKELNEHVPAELPVHLYSDNLLKRFQGRRPEIAMALNWNTFTSNDTTSKIDAFAFKTLNDSIRIFSASSNASATFYTSENIPKAGNSEYKLGNNKIQIFPAMNAKREIDLDTSRMHIAIYTDQFATDANYVKAAVEAIQQYTQRDIQVYSVNKASEIKSGMHWLFWLSEKPIVVPQNTMHIFVYEKGNEESINSWITTMDDFGINQESVKLTRRIKLTRPSKDNLETIWKDGFGNPLLTKENQNTPIYHFYSRFNPDWNELPWSPQISEMLYDLIMDRDGPANEWDKRIIDESQPQPIIAKGTKGFDKAKFVHTTDLSKFFWLAAFVIFCIERFLSLRNNNKNLYA